MFGASLSVRAWLYEQGLHPDMQYLPDVKFFKKVVSIMVAHFSYKPAIVSEQFFKYGFAEQKMLMCVDFINLVKKKHKALKTHAQLNRKR